MSENNRLIMLADYIRVYVGPPTMPTDDQGAWQNSMIPIGLLQSFSLQTGKTIQRVGEIGSKAKRLISRRGGKGITINRMMTSEASVFKAFYAWHLSHPAHAEEELTRMGNLWLTFDDPTTDEPIGVILQLNKRNEDGTIDAVSYKYLENFQFTSRGGITQEGDKGIIENAMATWGNTKNIKVG